MAARPPQTDLTRIVRNRSSRGGVVPKIIVIHTTEGHNRPGVVDLESLAGWFDNPAAQASSHLGIDGEGNTIRMVPDGEKAWTQAALNPPALSIEQVGFAATAEDDWYRLYHAQLFDVARWVEWWGRTYSIPLRRARTLGSSVVRAGIATHEQLGSSGGDHHDPGKGYPVDYIILLARLIRSPRNDRVRAKVNNRRALHNLPPIHSI